MCDDLVNAIETHEALGTTMDKGAMMLMKAAAKSISKVSKAMNEHIKESEEKLNHISDEVRSLRKSFDDYKMDATKYRLIVEVFKALFGSAKRSIMTLVYVGVLFGLVNMKDVIELLKMMI